MKKILATLLLGTALAVAALPVSAEGVDNAVTLTASGSTAAVHLDLPENEAKGVTALRLSFQVDSSDDVAAKFIFDDSLTASVQQYTYNEKTQILNVYLAGRSELLSQDGEADLGTIQLDGAEGSTATVTFVMDSLELVDASLGKTETTVISNGDVDMTVSIPSNPTPAPESTPAPTQAPSGGNTSGNAGQSSSSGSQNSGSSQDDQSDENTATSTATSTDTPGVTAKPSAGQSTSGSKKPSSTSKATPTPEATATPDQDAQVQETTAPSESSTPAPAETATPEQSLSEQDGGSQLPVAPIAIAVVVVVAAIIGVAVIRFRG